VGAKRAPVQKKAATAAPPKKRAAPPSKKAAVKPDRAKAAKRKGAGKASAGARKPDAVRLAAGYRPSAKEPYMNPSQLEFFRQKLLAWRQELLDESQSTIDEMRNAARDVSDEAERASREAEISFELRTRDRYRKLLNKIDQALHRIEDGSYGYCEETGEPIGIERLEARPVATLSIEAQQRRERLERQYGDQYF
jgi:DnaK suppressor protein